jgi:hypothetical protein
MIDTIIQQIPNPSKYVVDIGASTGVPTDPAYKYIIDKEYRGLCVEGNAANANRLRSNTHFDIHNGYINPENAIEIFARYNVPTEFDYLKIDIDGYDLDVLRKLLLKYKPAIICAEINEKIPPPIQFEVKYKPSYEWDYSHCFGFSIAAGERALKIYGYTIIDIYENNNLLAIRNDMITTCSITNVPTIKSMYEHHYQNNKSRLITFPWNKSVDYWQYITNTDILRHNIIYYFEHVNERSRFYEKTKHVNVDFLCE